MGTLIDASPIPRRQYLEEIVAPDRHGPPGTFAPLTKHFSKPPEDDHSRTARPFLSVRTSLHIPPFETDPETLAPCAGCPLE